MRKSGEHHIVGFVNGYKNLQEKQKGQIKEWCKSKKKILSKIYAENVYDLLLNLTKGDVVVITSLSKLSTEFEILGQMLFACSKNEVGIISIEESHFLDLTPNEYNKTNRHNERKRFEHLRFIAYEVLHGEVPVRK